MTTLTRPTRKLSPTVQDLAVAYYRVSTAEQAGEGHQSLDVQREKAHREADKRGKAIVREFVDIYTGTKAGRKAYQEMLSYLRDGNAGVVFVQLLDRLGRSQRELLTVTWELEDAGIELVSIDKDYDSRSVVDTAIYPMLAQMESERISLRVRGTISRAVKNGSKVGVAPYGYRKHIAEGGVLVWQQDPVQAAIVRRMYAMRVIEAKGFKGIADALNVQGVPSPRGSQWQAVAVQRVLTNPALRGAMDYATGRYFREVKDGVEASTTEDYYPAILTREEWDRLASFDMLAKGNKGHGNRAGYVLSGVLRCAHCGGPMVGNTTKGKRRYGCSRYRQTKARCSFFNSHDAEKLETAVFRWIERHTDPAHVRAAMKAHDAHAAARDVDAQRKTLEAEIAKLDADFSMAMDMLRRGVINEDAFRRDHEPREAQRAVLTAELGRIEREVHQEAARARFAAAVPSMVTELKNLLAGGHVGAAKAILRRLIGKATVDTDNVIRLTLAGGGNGNGSIQG